MSNVEKPFSTETPFTVDAAPTPEQALTPQELQQRRKDAAFRKQSIGMQAATMAFRACADRARRAVEQARKDEEAVLHGAGDKISALPPPPASCVDDADPASMHAWMLDDETSAHPPNGRRASRPMVPLRRLKDDLGVAYYRVPLHDFAVVNRLVKERNFKHTDTLKIATPSSQNFLKIWFAEHFNDDEQMRLVTKGSCYYDVRPSDGAGWVRMHLTAGDLISIPAGMYHRGSLDERGSCEMMRLYADVIAFAPTRRDVDEPERRASRAQYVRTLRTNSGHVGSALGFA